MGSLPQAVDTALAGGLVVAPSGPGLAVDLVNSPSYRTALTTADLALTDSGWMVLLWRLLTGETIPRHSGLKLMRALLDHAKLKQPGAVFWVMPSIEERDRNIAWLQAQGFPVSNDDTYIAPRYPQEGDLRDDTLNALLQTRRPAVVMLAIGGGVQERLGLALRDALPYHPSICCLGAAIAFLSGGQTNIPPWADRFYLGWFLRLVSSPSKYWHRYWSALPLALMIYKAKDQLPPLKGK